MPDELNISWIHRKTQDADIYFVASKDDFPVDVSLSFRVSDKTPQIWDAISGNQQDAKIWKEADGRTNVAVSLPSNGSTIIVFTKNKKQAFASKVTYNDTVILNTETGWFRRYSEDDKPKLHFKDEDILPSTSGEYVFHQEGSPIKKHVFLEEKSIQSNWKLAFETGWDTPNTIEISELKPLNELEDKAIKHYSGTTTYSKTIDVDRIGKHMILDLGHVANIAEVWCNGNKVGVKWAPPFEFDLSQYVIKGKNSFDIKVTNTWRNQLIYDNARPKNQKKTWTTNPPKKDEVQLEPSGLIGPVVLRRID